MRGFHYRSGEFWCDGLRLGEVAEAVGTPAYVYSAETILSRYRELRDAFAAVTPLICYSVKACGNVHLCRLLAREGAGFDIVSAGELYRVLRAGGDPQRVVFAGVGKREDEIRYALEADIFFFNVESEAELRQINATAASVGKRARVALRVNPDVDAQTHAYVTTGTKETKFGLDPTTARRLLERAGEFPHVTLAGLHMHIGSQITVPQPYVTALEKLMAFRRGLGGAGAGLTHLNVGGGFGIQYHGESAPAAAEFASAMAPVLTNAGLNVIMEPGRFIIGKAAVLLTRVLYVKPSSNARRFIICDAGMNDLIRPALYGSYHRVWPVAGAGAPAGGEGAHGPLTPAEVVGPVCETGDFLARDRLLPPVRAGDLLAVFDAGAYGMAMSSNYNSRPRACEVLVEDGRFRTIRRRETFEDLIAAENA